MRFTIDVDLISGTARIINAAPVDVGTIQRQVSGTGTVLPAMNAGGFAGPTPTAENPMIRTEIVTGGQFMGPGMYEPPGISPITLNYRTDM